MEERNKTYRIRTEATATADTSNIQIKLEQDYNTFEILSLKLNTEDTFKLHNANYGVIVGRVIANGGFGVPNAKISIFIETDETIDDIEKQALYPFSTTNSVDSNGIRYNLLPDAKVNDCHENVGSFPNKTYLLDNDAIIEIYDKYYKYTTRSNNSGDYMICGVPTGNHTIHMDLDLSDCGILSQRPRDFVYKGYTIEQFENPNQFKKDGDLRYLSQIFTQDKIVNVIPFWGNEELGETIGISRADIDVNFKFEPTCIFMGSVISDSASNGISKKCVPTNQMGAMDELTTGQGYIEMIRKTPAGDTEEFQVKGTQVINGDGVWCYQIPMNLDYMMTDEYGNMVPTDDPEKGIPTRTRVRFRLSMNDFENNDNYFRGKMLIPHNPQDYLDKSGHEEYDYNFGTSTRDESYRDLFWNNVYTVKSYIPRFQQSQSWRSERFSGIKHCNIYGQNNPLPYNNIRIKLPLMFMILCALIKAYVNVVSWVNGVIYFIADALTSLAPKLSWVGGKLLWNGAAKMSYIILTEGLCPDLENWYFSPIKALKKASSDFLEAWNYGKWDTVYLFGKTFDTLTGNTSIDTSFDKKSTDYTNRDDNESVCLTIATDYLLSCIEMNLAQEYKVINFDFYNDWINGLIYLPRWMREVRPKRTWLFGLIKFKEKIKACVASDSDGYTKYDGKTRYYMQQCALQYSWSSSKGYTKITTVNGCDDGDGKKKAKQKCHLADGKRYVNIFGKANGGIIRQTSTSKDQYVYYYKPCEWSSTKGKKTNLFATDIVLLGSLEECNLYGIPQAFKNMSSSSYKMPTNLALTNLDEEAYLYGGDSQTLCTSNRNQEMSGVTQVGVSGMTYEAMARFTQPANGPMTEKYTYGENDKNGESPYNDAIPTTEAAGIAWNYTGPGQGIKDENTKQGLYMPGGHFLGISCINSETNIKSCVNLQRICEMGTSMSQRREIGHTADKDGVKYSYFVPTGLISTEDITDANFRSMFATLNTKRLIADSKDKNTGYPIYSFIYSRPNGFDGSLNSRIKGNYNFMDDSEKERLSADSQYIISQGTSQIYDSEIKKAISDEIKNTQRRTLEGFNRDYYMFRMGLNDDTVGNKTINEKKFAITNGQTASLPQYENSFYFYFGLKDGSTALDEFYKQFFSVCSTGSKEKSPYLIMSASKIDKCLFTGTLTLLVRNMGDITKVVIHSNDSNTDTEVDSSQIEKIGENETRITIPNIKIGNYLFTIEDNNGLLLKHTFSYTDESMIASLDGGFNPANFTKKTKQILPLTGKTHYEHVAQNVYDSGFTYGGYVDLSGIYKISDEGYPVTGNSIYFLIKDTDNYYVTNYTGAISGPYDTTIMTRAEWLNNKISLYDSADTNTRRIALWKGATYQLYFGRKCSSDAISFRYYDSFIVGGFDGLDLKLGDTTASYYDVLSIFPGDWWKKEESYIYNNILIAASRNKEKAQRILWALKHYTFKQNSNSAETFNNRVAVYGDDGTLGGGSILFGQPESETGKIAAGIAVPNTPVYNENEYDFYAGYSLDDTESYRCTDSPDSSADLKLPFGKMAYSLGTDEYLSEGTRVTIKNIVSGYNGEHKVWTITLKNWIASKRYLNGHGCGLYIDNIMDLYPIVVDNTTLKATVTEDMEDIDFEDLQNYINTSTTENATIYPMFYYPVIDKPMWCDMAYSVTSRFKLENANYSEYEVRRAIGNIYNAITYPVKNDYGNEYYTLSEDSVINGVNAIKGNSENIKLYNGMPNTAYVSDFDSGNFGATTMSIADDRVYAYSVEAPNADPFDYKIIEGAPVDFNDTSIYGTSLNVVENETESPFSEINLVKSGSSFYYRTPNLVSSAVTYRQCNLTDSAFKKPTLNAYFDVIDDTEGGEWEIYRWVILASVNGKAEVVELKPFLKYRSLEPDRSSKGRKAYYEVDLYCAVIIDSLKGLTKTFLVKQNLMNRQFGRMEPDEATIGSGDTDTWIVWPSRQSAGGKELVRAHIFLAMCNKIDDISFLNIFESLFPMTASDSKAVVRGITNYSGTTGNLYGLLKSYYDGGRKIELEKGTTRVDSQRSRVIAYYKTMASDGKGTVEIIKLYP